MSDSAADRSNLLTLTAAIVAAHAGGNKVEADALPGLIRSVYGSLATAGAPTTAEEPAREPAVPVRKSIQQDYLVCLEDGAKMKMLKRYIAKRFDLTPAQYRARWGLPADYPMVAPGYAERRSTLAKELGLGRKPKANTAGSDAAVPTTDVEVPTSKRGRKPKATAA